MNRYLFPIVMCLTAMLSACKRDAEHILPSRKGAWDVVKTETDVLNALGGVDSTIIATNVAVIVFSDDGKGSFRSIADDFVSPIVWSSGVNSYNDRYYLELSYLGGSADSLNYHFDVEDLSGKKMMLTTAGEDPKTHLDQNIRWFLERSK